MMLEAVMDRSDNVVQLRPKSAPSRAVARSQPEPERGLADVLVVGGALAGLMLLAQQLVLGLSAG
jgi:DNA mismatch repair protein MutH